MFPRRQNYPPLCTMRLDAFAQWVQRSCFQQVTQGTHQKWRNVSSHTPHMPTPADLPHVALPTSPGTQSLLSCHLKSQLWKATQTILPPMVPTPKWFCCLQAFHNTPHHLQNHTHLPPQSICFITVIDLRPDWRGKCFDWKTKYKAIIILVLTGVSDDVIGSLHKWTKE